MEPDRSSPINDKDYYILNVRNESKINFDKKDLKVIKNNLHKLILRANKTL